VNLLGVVAGMVIKTVIFHLLTNIGNRLAKLEVWIGASDGFLVLGRIVRAIEKSHSDPLTNDSLLIQA